MKKPTPQQPHRAADSRAGRLQAALGIYLRGVCMGAADLVPGVSGGTVAFISGIYARLLAALSGFTQPAWWRALGGGQWRQVWRECDAGFLLLLFAGILSAVLTLADVLHYALSARPHILLGFFSGLVAVSVAPMRRRLSAVRPAHIVAAAVLAMLTAWAVTVSPAPLRDVNLTTLFLGGMVAICAMILPGISGSYVLLILGLYSVVITALHERDWLSLLVFSAGCGVGLLLFSRVLSLLLRRWTTGVTVALIGVMIGALPKLWPWKEAAEGTKIILQANISPSAYHLPPDILWVSIAAIAGAVLVLAIDRLTFTATAPPSCGA